ncbi:MAG: hypothetical protein ACR2O3_07990 [Rhizobiaceae bacterium]
MEPIKQLKTLRDEALHRLQGNPDYKLLTSLDDLIIDLEGVTKTNRPKFMIIDEVDETEDEPTLDSKEADSVDEAFEKISAELDDEDEAENTDEPPAIVSFS